jgi:hypothetical protein
LCCACCVVARVSCFFIRAHGVVVSHPLCMRKALGSIPSVSIVSLRCPATPCCVVVARGLAHGQNSLAEWSKALAQCASPQGRGFEPHSCHWVRRGFLLRRALVAKPQVRNDRAHGVVVSHPLSMREALGSIPSVSKFCLGTFVVLCKSYSCRHTALFVNDSCGVRTHALADWRLEPAP